MAAGLGQLGSWVRRSGGKGGGRARAGVVEAETATFSHGEAQCRTWVGWFGVRAGDSPANLLASQLAGKNALTLLELLALMLVSGPCC